MTKEKLLEQLKKLGVKDVDESQDEKKLEKILKKAQKEAKKAKGKSTETKSKPKSKGKDAPKPKAKPVFDDDGNLLIKREVVTINGVKREQFTYPDGVTIVSDPIK